MAIQHVNWHANWSLRVDSLHFFEDKEPSCGKLFLSRIMITTTVRVGPNDDERAITIRVCLSSAYDKTHYHTHNSNLEFFAQSTAN